MDYARVCDWLQDRGGPVVRYQAAHFAADTVTGANVGASRQTDLLDTPVVSKWLARLRPDGFTPPADASGWRRLGDLVHGSKPDCLENVFGKLAEYGLRAGMEGLDERVLPYRRIFSCETGSPAAGVFALAWENLVKGVVAWGLLRLGYLPDPPMEDYIRRHLRLCWKIAHDQVFDLYAPAQDLRGLPKAWAGKSILRQDVMAGYWLPWIHDLLLFANLPAGFLDTNEATLLDEWTSYILDPRFQALPNGYGYAWIPERRTCYGWGWSPHLPGFFGFDGLTDTPATPLLLYLEQLARLPAGRRAEWTGAALRHLDTFRIRLQSSTPGPDTTTDRWRFPVNYLAERTGYYVSGSGMGLGETRHGSEWAVLESTVRMLRIRAVMRMTE